MPRRSAACLTCTLSQLWAPRTRPSLCRRITISSLPRQIFSVFFISLLQAPSSRPGVCEKKKLQHLLLCKENYDLETSPGTRVLTRSSLSASCDVWRALLVSTSASFTLFRTRSSVRSLTLSIHCLCAHLCMCACLREHRVHADSGAPEEIRRICRAHQTSARGPQVHTHTHTHTHT